MSEKKDLNPARQLEAFEIESLNIESLDVEELERRLELAAGLPLDMGWTCDCDNYTCTTNCNCYNYTCTTYTCETLCSYDCGMDCGVNVPYCSPDYQLPA